MNTLQTNADRLLFEMGAPGRVGVSLPACDVPEETLDIPAQCLRTASIGLPELGEFDVVRHFTALSQRNYCVDGGFYPLGSCTMKYNPKLNDAIAALPGFTQLHPEQPVESAQGCLQLLYETERLLAEITGMDAFTLQPAAGAHGEMTGLMLIRAYHEARGDVGRVRVLIPDSAHGTNPASASVAGLETREIASNARGGVDLDALRAAMDDSVAALMLTNPNTLGLFEEDILEIARIVHEKGGLLYYDGANYNALLGIARPGDMGFDVVHLNLHKTFSTPHGGGGPGAGPVGVKQALAPFLPVPRVCKGTDGAFSFCEDTPQSIGRVKAYYGNFSVIVRAYAYIRFLGALGLHNASVSAVLSANYIRARLRPYYELPYERIYMHEVVFSASRQKQHGVSALDVAKRLIDFGFHPPTIYFPLIVKEALMIEPTETESLETLDAFIEAMIQIAREAETEPESLTKAPHDAPRTRMNETQAARQPVLIYTKEA